MVRSPVDVIYIIYDIKPQGTTHRYIPRQIVIFKLVFG